MTTPAARQLLLQLSAHRFDWLLWGIAAAALLTLLLPTAARAQTPEATTTVTASAVVTDTTPVAPEEALTDTLSLTGTSSLSGATSLSGTTDVTATVVVSSLNVRAGPGTGYARVGGVKAGDVLTVAGRNASCGWISVVTPKGASGWVSGAARYVTLHGRCVDLPVVDEPADRATPTPVAVAAQAPVTETAVTETGTLSVTEPALASSSSQGEAAPESAASPEPAEPAVAPALAEGDKTCASLLDGQSATPPAVAYSNGSSFVYVYEFYRVTEKAKADFTTNEALEPTIFEDPGPEGTYCYAAIDNTRLYDESLVCSNFNGYMNNPDLEEYHRVFGQAYTFTNQANGEAVTVELALPLGTNEICFEPGSYAAVLTQQTMIAMTMGSDPIHMSCRIDLGAVEAVPGNRLRLDLPKYIPVEVCTPVTGGS